METGAFLIEGARGIQQISESHPEAIIEIITAHPLPPLFQPYTVKRVTPRQLQSICISKTTQGVIAVVRLPANSYSNQLPEKVGRRILLLEDIQDPGNVGTLIRTAASFNFSGIIMTAKCADPFAPKCVQSTAGTVLSIWIRRTRHYLGLVDELKSADFRVVILDLNGKVDLSILSISNRLLLGLGNEASGPTSALIKASDALLKIPIQRDKAESLNVAASGAIGMYLSSVVPQAPY